MKRKINMTSASPRGWHRLQLATECLQKYAFTYEEQLDADGNKPAKAEVKGPGLIRGSLMHLALAQHYSIMRTLQEGGERDEWSEPETAVELIARRDNGLKFLDDVLHTYREYCKTYPFEREIKTHKIVAVEDLYQTMIGGKWLLTGRVDLAYENQAGEIIVVDHKCLPLSARVLTSDGVRSVAELIEAGTDWTCMAWDGKKAVLSKALCPEPAGVQPIFEIKLGDGTFEKFGHTHPIYTQRGWVPASEVVKGDIVGTTIPVDLPENANYSDAELRLIGMALSDGGRVKPDSDDSYVITANDVETRKFIVEALRENGDQDDWSVHTYKKVDKGIRIFRRASIYSVLCNLGVVASLAVDKQFPAELFNLSNRQIGVLLGAFWEGDGSVCLGTKVGNSRPLRIAFSSRSYSLTEGIKLLLNRLGLASNITTSTVVEAPYHQVFVVGSQSKLKFLELAIAGVINCPISVQGGKTTRKGNVLESFIDFYDYEKAKKVRNTNITKNPEYKDNLRWVEVVEIESLPEELCYSIEVPEHHTFLISSGLITHNTTGRLTKAHDNYYSTHGQLFGYFHLAKKHFGEEKVAGFKVNLMEVSQNPKFNRIDLGRAPLIESTFEQNVIDIEERIVHIKEKNRPLDEWPKSINELTCYGRYGPCQFMQRCKYGAAANRWVWEDEDE